MARCWIYLSDIIANNKIDELIGSKWWLKLSMIRAAAAVISIDNCRNRIGDFVTLQLINFAKMKRNLLEQSPFEGCDVNCGEGCR